MKKRKNEEKKVNRQMVFERERKGVATTGIQFTFLAFPCYATRFAWRPLSFSFTLEQQIRPLKCEIKGQTLGPGHHSVGFVCERETRISSESIF